MSVHHRIEGDTGVVEVDTYGHAEGEIFLDLTDTSPGGRDHSAVVILTVDEAREVLEALVEAIKDAQ